MKKSGLFATAIFDRVGEPKMDEAIHTLVRVVNMADALCHGQAFLTRARAPGGLADVQLR